MSCEDHRGRSQGWEAPECSWEDNFSSAPNPAWGAPQQATDQRLTSQIDPNAGILLFLALTGLPFTIETKLALTHRNLTASVTEGLCPTPGSPQFLEK